MSAPDLNQSVIIHGKTRVLYPLYPLLCIFTLGLLPLLIRFFPTIKQKFFYRDETLEKCTHLLVIEQAQDQPDSSLIMSLLKRLFIQKSNQIIRIKTALDRSQLRNLLKLEFYDGKKRQENKLINILIKYIKKESNEQLTPCIRTSNKQDHGHRRKDRCYKSDEGQYKLDERTRNESKGLNDHSKSDKSQYKSDKTHFKSDKSQYKSDKSQYKSEEDHFKSDKSEFKSDNDHFKSNENYLNPAGPLKLFLKETLTDLSFLSTPKGIRYIDIHYSRFFYSPLGGIFISTKQVLQEIEKNREIRKIMWEMYRGKEEIEWNKRHADTVTAHIGTPNGHNISMKGHASPVNEYINTTNEHIGTFTGHGHNQTDHFHSQGHLHEYNSSQNGIKEINTTNISCNKYETLDQSDGMSNHKLAEEKNISCNKYETLDQSDGMSNHKLAEEKKKSRSGKSEQTRLHPLEYDQIGNNVLRTEELKRNRTGILHPRDNIKETEINMANPLIIQLNHNDPLAMILCPILQSQLNPITNYLLYSLNDISLPPKTIFQILISHLFSNFSIYVLVCVVIWSKIDYMSYAICLLIMNGVTIGIDIVEEIRSRDNLKVIAQENEEVGQGHGQFQIVNERNNLTAPANSKETIKNRTKGGNVLNKRNKSNSTEELEESIERNVPNYFLRNQDNLKIEKTESIQDHSIVQQIDSSKRENHNAEIQQTTSQEKEMEQRCSSNTNIHTQYKDSHRELKNNHRDPPRVCTNYVLKPYDPDTSSPSHPILIINQSPFSFTPIPSSHLFPNDILLLQKGHPPADIKLLNCTVLVNEAFLTGESVAVERNKDQIVRAGTSIREIMGDTYMQHKEIALPTRYLGFNSSDYHKNISNTHKNSSGPQWNKDSCNPVSSDKDRSNFTNSVRNSSNLDSSNLDSSKKISLGSVKSERDSLGLQPFKIPLAQIVNTGFDTTKGGLVRSLLVNSSHMSVFIISSTLIIIFCFLIGLFTAISLFIYLIFIKDEIEILFYYTLDLIITIITPALPATLYIGINMTCKRLQSFYIKCNDIARITNIADTELIIFDKTGTLTEEGLDLYEVYKFGNGGETIDCSRQTYQCTAQIDSSCLDQPVSNLLPVSSDSDGFDSLLCPAEPESDEFVSDHLSEQPKLNGSLSKHEHTTLPGYAMEQSSEQAVTVQDRSKIQEKSGKVQDKSKIQEKSGKVQGRLIQDRLVNNTDYLLNLSMSACHTLTLLPSTITHIPELSGDPLDIKMFNHTGSVLLPDKRIDTKDGLIQIIGIIPFDSNRRRQTVLVSLMEGCGRDNKNDTRNLNTLQQGRNTHDVNRSNKGNNLNIINSTRNIDKLKEENTSFKGNKLTNVDISNNPESKRNQDGASDWINSRNINRANEMSISHTITPTHYLFTKGSPESIFPLLTANEQQKYKLIYEQKNKEYALRGYRVIAMAYRVVQVKEGNKGDSINYNGNCPRTDSRTDYRTDSRTNSITNTGNQTADPPIITITNPKGNAPQSLDNSESLLPLESDLQLLCFLIFCNSLKPDTPLTINHLHGLSYKTYMATGDNLLTAISVGRACGIIKGVVCVPYGRYDVMGEWICEWYCIGEGRDSGLAKKKNLLSEKSNTKKESILHGAFHPTYEDGPKKSDHKNEDGPKKSDHKNEDGLKRSTHVTMQKDKKTVSEQKFKPHGAEQKLQSIEQNHQSNTDSELYFRPTDPEYQHNSPDPVNIPDNFQEAHYNETFPVCSFDPIRKKCFYGTEEVDYQIALEGKEFAQIFSNNQEMEKIWRGKGTINKESLRKKRNTSNKDGANMTKNNNIRDTDLRTNTKTNTKANVTVSMDDTPYNMIDDTLKELILEKCVIYGRMTPDDKKTLVGLLPGIFVGDGANDVGALQQSKIGMAISANHCTLNSSFITESDSLLTVCKLIEEGRQCLIISYSTFKFTLYSSLLQFISFIIMTINCFFVSDIGTMHYDLVIVLVFAITMSTSENKGCLEEYREQLQAIHSHRKDASNSCKENSPGHRGENITRQEKEVHLRHTSTGTEGNASHSNTGHKKIFLNSSAGNLGPEGKRNDIINYNHIDPNTDDLTHISSSPVKGGSAVHIKEYNSDNNIDNMDYTYVSSRTDYDTDLNNITDTDNCTKESSPIRSSSTNTDSTNRGTPTTAPRTDGLNKDTCLKIDKECSKNTTLTTEGSKTIEPFNKSMYDVLGKPFLISFIGHLLIDTFSMIIITICCRKSSKTTGMFVHDTACSTVLFFITGIMCINKGWMISGRNRLAVIGYMSLGIVMGLYLLRYHSSMWDNTSNSDGKSVDISNNISGNINDDRTVNNKIKSFLCTLCDKIVIDWYQLVELSSPEWFIFITVLVTNSVCGIIWERMSNKEREENIRENKKYYE